MRKFDKARLFTALLLATCFVLWKHQRMDSSEGGLPRGLQIRKQSESPILGSPASTVANAQNGAATSITPNASGASSILDVQSAGNVPARVISMLGARIKLVEQSQLTLVEHSKGLASERFEFQQKYMGLVIRPRGGVTITLGQAGELIDFASSAVESIELQNKNLRNPGVQNILWIQGQKAWFAEVTLADGVEWVRDVNTGRVLGRLDSRKF